MKKMNTISVWLMAGILLGLAGCSGPAGHDEGAGAAGNGGAAGNDGGKEFEGVITYRISYVGRNDSAIYGDTMWLYYSKGNIARVYNSKGTETVVKEVFYGEGHRSLIKTGASDTIMTYDMADPGGYDLGKTTRAEEDTRVLGHPCKKLELEEVHQGDVRDKVYNNFLYSADVLQVDKRHFEKWNFGHFNNYINEAGALYLKYECRYSMGDGGDLISRTFTAVNIREQKVDSSVFHLDTTLTKQVQF